jgi:hypothetical protein
MPKAYSADMRERVIAEVEGGASRREAAEEFEVSASTAVIWVKCFRDTGRCAAKPFNNNVHDDPYDTGIMSTFARTVRETKGARLTVGHRTRRPIINFRRSD